MKKMMCFLVICLASQALTQSTSRSLQDSHGECTSPPSGVGAGVPSSHGTPPSGGGGGGYYNPPSSSPPVVVPTPTTPVVVGQPATPTYGPGPGVPSSHGAPPSGGGGGGYYNPPSSSTPVVVPTPTTPVVVGPPATPTYPLLPPGTPFIPIDPNAPPFTCDYWRTHPNAIWALFGFWCPLGQIFGLPNPAAFATTNPTLLDALSNTRRDGIGELYREATAAFLNSLADHRFYFTGQQVRDSFRAAVGSDQAASAQAQMFKRANEGRLKRH